MGRELWAELSAVISLVDHDFVDNPDAFHSTAAVVRCHLWSVLHERPTCWAAEASNWDRLTRPLRLPSQSTLSRRLRGEDFEAFMNDLARRLRHLPGMGTLFKRVDGKPLTVAAHSKDPHARFGHVGSGRTAKGYKLHALNDGGAMPADWRLTPMNTSEQEMARRMLRDLPTPAVVAADCGYDANVLYAAAAVAGARLVAGRSRARAGAAGHRRQHPDRLRALDGGPMTRKVLHDRPQIERDFANLCAFGGGLGGLPAWARTYGRVHRWVWAKLMINAARIRLLERRKSRSCA